MYVVGVVDNVVAVVVDADVAGVTGGVGVAVVDYIGVVAAGGTVVVAVFLCVCC